MFGITLAYLAVFLLAIAAVIAAVFALVRSSRDHPEDVPEEVRSAARRHGVAASLAGLALVAVATAAVSAIEIPAIPGLGLALAPTVGGLVWLTVQAVAERTWPKPEGAVRTASLSPRQAPDLGEAGSIWLRLTLAMLAITLPVYGSTAGEDGRSVRGVDAGLDSAAGPAISHAGPYPGPPYVWPIAIALVLLVLLAVVVVRLIARRPAVPGLRETDDRALRELSVRRAMAGLQMAMGATTLGLSAFASLALRNAGHHGASGAALAPATIGLIALVMGAVGVVLAVTGLDVERRPAGRGSGSPQAEEG